MHCKTSINISLKSRDVSQPTKYTYSLRFNSAFQYMSPDWISIHYRPLNSIQTQKCANIKAVTNSFPELWTQLTKQMTLHYKTFPSTVWHRLATFHIDQESRDNCDNHLLRFILERYATMSWHESVNGFSSRLDWWFAPDIWHNCIHAYQDVKTFMRVRPHTYFLKMNNFL